MIFKIEGIQSVGKFQNFNSRGDLAFRKLTLIYSDNGGGKTTLANLFRSLSLNNPELIRKRISIGSTLPQSAQVIQRDQTGATTHHTFGCNGWTTPLPDTEIFDTTFINENVYSGFAFTEDHQQKLHEFVIGAQGVAIRNQMEQNRLDKSAKRLAIDGLQEQLVNLIANEISNESIQECLGLSIPDQTTIDNEIQEAQAKLVAARNTSLIRALSLLNQIQEINLNIDYDAISSDLELEIEDLSSQALNALFTDHCQKLTNTGLSSPETWLKTGFFTIHGKPIKDTECPFCGQSLMENNRLIQAYVAKFNEAFNALLQRLSNANKILSEKNIPLIVERLIANFQKNSEMLSAWRTHYSSLQSLDTTEIIEKLEDLPACFSRILASVEFKIKEPSHQVDTETVRNFVAALTDINVLLQAYAENITGINNQLLDMRSRILTEDQAKHALIRKEWQKKLLDSQVQALINSLGNEKSQLRQLEAQYRILATNLETNASQFFTQYQTQINHYLQVVFHTPFRIEEVTHIAPRGRSRHSRLGYKLTINGHDIEFDHTLPNSAKEVLSEGDKSTIALSFFLSKVDLSPNLSETRIVFDDPLSSFDRNRRTHTVALIKSLLPRVRQVIVLSHNEFLLHDLSIGVSPMDKKFLRIYQDAANNTSALELLDLECLVENQYFRDVKKLENFRQFPDLNRKEEVLGTIRNVLESHIRFKFYRQTRAIPAHGRTFGRLITELDTANVSFRSATPRTNTITKLNILNSISCRPHHGEPLPDYDQLGLDPNTMTETELSQYVDETLDLIDNQL